ncbi:uncharacterized protein LOC129588795 isoform X2 [Paramacrobiotus metropolitanus]|uniref:uncharacterized protein LOC129588795 isoform X2 n=1 Tax=Paramacrobiotus metropolitanus TaxID=2943436 RepID=UPI00244655EA|nr:uncharacterized protein LOC129588795 isoform X2 [Paramacrobiotus metropolitanus]
MSRTAIGILIDVSDSMRQVYSDIQSKNEDEKTSRMQTVFDTVVQAASEESGKSNCGLFAVAFGIKTESGVEYLIDIFSLLKFQNIVRRHMKENGYITDDDSNRPRWHEDGQSIWLPNSCSLLETWQKLHVPPTSSRVTLIKPFVTIRSLQRSCGVCSWDGAIAITAANRFGSRCRTVC